MWGDLEFLFRFFLFWFSESVFLFSMQIESGIAPPERPERRKWLTAEVKAMKPGDSFVCEYDRLCAFKAFARYHKWTVVQQKLDEKQFRVWRMS